MGTKLLGTDVRIAARLVWKTLRGKRLSRYAAQAVHVCLSCCWYNSLCSSISIA